MRVYVAKMGLHLFQRNSSTMTYGRPGRVDSSTMTYGRPGRVVGHIGRDPLIFSLLNTLRTFFDAGSLMWLGVKSQSLRGVVHRHLSADYAGDALLSQWGC